MPTGHPGLQELVLLHDRTPATTRHQLVHDLQKSARNRNARNCAKYWSTCSSREKNGLKDIN